MKMVSLSNSTIDNMVLDKIKDEVLNVLHEICVNSIFILMHSNIISQETWIQFLWFAFCIFYDLITSNDPDCELQIICENMKERIEGQYLDLRHR